MTPESPTQPAEVRTRLLARNSGLNLVGTVLPAIAAVISIPVLITLLGVDGFGILTLLWVFLGTFSLLDLGLSRALTQVVAERIGQKACDDIPELVRTAALAAFALGLAAGVALVALGPWLMQDIITMPQALRDDATKAVWAVAAAAPFLVSGASLRGVLEARQLFGLVNAVRVPMGLLTYLGPLLVLLLGGGLVAISVLLAAGRVVAWALYALMVRYLTPDWEAVHGTSKGLWPTLRTLLRQGSWMTVSNLISPLMIYGDRFVIGAVLTTAAVAYYATPLEVATKLLLIPSAIASVLFPAFGSLSGHAARSRQLYRRGLLATGAILLPASIILIVVAGPSLAWWIDPSFAEEAAPILQILAIGCFFNGLAAIPFARIQGTGRPYLTAALHLLEAPVYLLALWVLLQRFGIVGAAWAWAGRVIVDFLALHVICVRIDRRAS